MIANPLWCSRSLKVQHHTVAGAYFSADGIALAEIILLILAVPHTDANC
jgi:hypothetical protein